MEGKDGVSIYTPDIQSGQINDPSGFYMVIGL